MKDLINEIAAALKILGISGRITLHPIADLGRVKVADNNLWNNSHFFSRDIPAIRRDY